VRQKKLFFIDDLMKLYCSFDVSDFCCEAHVMSSIEDRRNCLFFLDEFILFILNKTEEEYDLFFCFSVFSLRDKLLREERKCKKLVKRLKNARLDSKFGRKSRYNLRKGH
jgi:hypothetical protein